jgi:hypothetical protein
LRFSALSPQLGWHTRCAGTTVQAGLGVASVRTQLRLITLPFLFVATTLPVSAAAQWYYPSESHLRINVKPREALVYVDGYFAGKVDDFDGALQRLHVPPGRHELTIYLEGYRSLKQQLYLSPEATRTITGSLEKLAPGEAQEPEPKPTEADRLEPPPDQTSRQPPSPPQRRPLPPRAPGGSERPPYPPEPRTAPPAPTQPSRFAALSIRVEPDGAVIRIDGERWDGPSGDERLIIQVPEGHHTIQVERTGYEPFTTEIDARGGETVPLTISLTRR